MVVALSEGTAQQDGSATRAAVERQEGQRPVQLIIGVMQSSSVARVN